MGKDRKKCGACNGNGGRWVLVQPDKPSQNGQAKRKQQKWQKCSACNGTGEA